MQNIYARLLEEELALRKGALNRFDPLSESPPPTADAPQAPESAQSPDVSPRRTRKPRKRRQISPAHHALRCSVCHHPEREAIEQGFLEWRRPADLASEFKLGHRTAIYRHAHAVGLVRRRATQMRHAIAQIIEQADTVKATASSVIRAVRAHACLDDFGRWSEPPRRVIIEHIETCPSCIKSRRGRSTSPQKPTPEGEEKVNRYTIRERTAITSAESVI